MEGKKDKKPSIRRIFVERMRREGRKKEWDATVRAVMSEHGYQYLSHAMPEAMKRLGYEGPKQERALHEAHLESERRAAAGIVVSEELRQLDAEQAAHTFQSALALLPNTAPVAMELDWIRSHPAMLRKNQMAGGGSALQQVEISVEDILHTDAGRAPSRAAVVQLVHWANHPNKFFEQVLSEQKKKTQGGDAGDGKAEGTADVESIRQMIESVS